MTRLRSDLVVAAILRRASLAHASAVLRRRGAGEAGAIFISVDQLDGRISLYAPAPPAMTDEPDQESSARVFECVLKDSDAPTIAARMKREEQFDSDLWWVEIEDRAGRSFCD